MQTLLESWQTASGLSASIFQTEGEHGGWWYTAYVAVPPSHVAFGQDTRFVELTRTTREITFAGTLSDDSVWYFGVHCNERFDRRLPPTKQNVVDYCEAWATQLAAFDAATKQRSRQHAAFTIVELLVAIGVVAVIMGLLFPSFARSREATRTLNCHINLRQINTCFVMYCDSQRSLPYSNNPNILNMLRTVIEVPDATWRCPSEKSTEVDFSYSYLGNRYLYTPPGIWLGPRIAYRNICNNPDWITFREDNPNNHCRWQDENELTEGLFTYQISWGPPTAGGSGMISKSFNSFE